MDLNVLLERNRLALRLQQEAASDEERRAYGQFVRDCAGPNQAAATKRAAPLAILATKLIR